MRLYELQNNIDDQLEKTAQGIGKPQPGTATSIQQGGMNPMGGGMDPMGAPMGDPMMGGVPPAGMGQEQNQPPLPNGVGPTDQDIDADRVAKVDDAVIAAASGHPYMTDYNHRDTKKPTHPLQLISAGMEDLRKVRNLAKVKIMNKTIRNEVGMFDRPDAKFYQDLLSFAERVMDAKKQAAKDHPHRDVKSQKQVQTQHRPESKVKPGEFRHNPNKA